MKTNDLHLVQRSLDAELNAEEAARLRRLLHLAPEARQELDALQAVRGLVAEHGGHAFAPHFADRVMRRVRRPALAPPQASLAERLGEALLPWRAVGWSLAVAALVAVGLALWLWPRADVVRVPYGETLSLVLPDGSAVELDGGSTLRYGPFEGADIRRVHLEGEAFFSVVEGERPFVVETFNAHVTVLGTRFNVRAWATDVEEATVVTLTSGRVEVVPQTSEAAPVVLAPGQTSVVRGDTTSAPVAARFSRVLAWRSGGLHFADQPLGSVAAALERRFDVEIRLASPELAAFPITYLNPHPASAPSVLADVLHVHGLRFRRTADGFLILREGGMGKREGGADPAAGPRRYAHL